MVQLVLAGSVGPLGSVGLGTGNIQAKHSASPVLVLSMRSGTLVARESKYPNGKVSTQHHHHYDS